MLFFINNILNQEELSSFVTLIHAPLVNSNLALNDNLWYSEEKLEQALPKHKKFDLALIDGPSAWHSKIELSRYPALPYLLSKLDDSFVFFFRRCK